MRIAAGMRVVLLLLVAIFGRSGGYGVAAPPRVIETTKQSGLPKTTRLEGPAEPAHELTRIAGLIRANYERLITLKGIYSVQDRQVVTDPKLLQTMGVANLPEKPRFGLHTTAVSHFAIDFKGDRLFSTCEVTAPSQLIETTGGAFNVLPVTSLTVPVRAATIANNEFTWCHRDEKFSRLKDRPELGNAVTKVAFVQPASVATGERWGFLIDPRQLFWGDAFLPTQLENMAEAAASNAKPPQGKVRRTVSVTRLEFPDFTRVKVDYRGEDGPTSAVTSFVADSRVGFNVTQYSVTVNGETNRTSSRQYATVSGVFIPANFTLQFPRSGHVPNATPELNFSRTLELTDVEVNVPVDESWFKFGNLGLEDGDRIANQINGKSYVLKNGEPVEVKAGELSAISKPKDKHANWYLAVSSLAATLVVLCLIFRKRRAKAEPTQK